MLLRLWNSSSSRANTVTTLLPAWSGMSAVKSSLEVVAFSGSTLKNTFCSFTNTNTSRRRAPGSADGGTSALPWSFQLSPSTTGAPFCGSGTRAMRGGSRCHAAAIVPERVPRAARTSESGTKANRPFCHSTR
jgi:hypothetical protein